MQPCADGFGALAHDRQPQMLRRHLVDDKAATVILHGKLRAVGAAFQPHRSVRGAGVLRHVVERLLRNVIEGNLDVRRQIRVAFDFQPDRHPRPPVDGLGELAQQFGQLHFDQRGGAQLQQQRPHFGQRAARQLPQFLDATLGLARVALPEPRQHFRNDTGRE